MKDNKINSKNKNKPISLNKTLTISKHEILSNIKRKQFLIMVIVVPLFMIVVTGATAYFTSEISSQKVGYIDYFGMNISKEYSIKNPLKNNSAIIKFIKYKNGSEELGKKDVLNDKINIFLIFPKNYMDNGTIIAYSKTKILPPSIYSVVRNIVLSTFLKNKVDDKTYKIVTSPIQLETYSISKKGAEKENIVSQLMPIGYAMLLYLSIISVAGLCVSSIVEEKQNRIMELLLISAKPFEILVGKIIGISVLGLLQMSIWILFALPLIIIVSLKLTPFLIICSIIFFILSYVFYISLLSGLSSLFTTQKDAGQILSPIMLIQIIPILLLTLIQTNPNHYIIKLLSYIPFTASQVILMKMSITYVGPLEVYSVMATMILFTILSCIVSTKLFKVGIMIYDEEMNIKKLIKLIKKIIFKKE